MCVCVYACIVALGSSKWNHTYKVAFFILSLYLYLKPKPYTQSIVIWNGSCNNWQSIYSYLRCSKFVGVVANMNECAFLHCNHVMVLVLVLVLVAIHMSLYDYSYCRIVNARPLMVVVPQGDLNSSHQSYTIDNNNRSQAHNDDDDEDDNRQHSHKFIHMKLAQLNKPPIKSIQVCFQLPHSWLREFNHSFISLCDGFFWLLSLLEWRWRHNRLCSHWSTTCIGSSSTQRPQD